MAINLGSASNIIGKRGKVEYMLSLDDPNTPSKKIIALPFVNMFRQEMAPAVNIRHTLGRAPIVEHSGTKRMVFTIQGRSGRHFFLGANAEGNLKFDSGVDLFQELVRFLQRHEEIASSRYFKRTGQYLSQGQAGGTLSQKRDYTPGHLSFMAPFEGLNYYVVPTSFVVNRSTATARHSYEFVLTLEATSEYIVPETDKGWWDKALEVAEYISDSIDSVSGAIAIGTAWLDQKNAELRTLLGPIDALARVGTELGNLEGSFGSTIDLFGNKANKFLAAVGSVTKNAYDILDKASFNSLQKMDKAGDFNAFMQGLAEARNKISIAFGQGALGTYNTDSDEPTTNATTDTVTTSTSTVAAALVAENAEPVILPSANPNFSYEKVLDGESLIQFASRLGFEVNDIAELNGMVNFYNGKFSVPLVGGMILKIPSDTPALVFPGDSDIFGTDLQLDIKTGDLVVKGSSPTDFFTISGPRNLKQGTTLRLLTREGENSVFPSLGLPVRAGEPSTAELIGSLAFETRAELLSDKRVTEITGLFVEDLGDTLNLNIEAVAGKDATIQFSVPIS